MKEYVERQKLFDALPDVKEDKQISLYGAIADFMVIASSIPSADVVEVVRCKDCKYCKIHYPSKIINEEAKKVYSCNVHWHSVRPDGYCSFGERKEQG